MPTERQLDDRTCCALTQFRAFETTTSKALRAAIDEKKLSGFRAVMVITKAGEPKLEKRLAKLEFKRIATFNRRLCYAQTPLKMWLLKI